MKQLEYLQERPLLLGIVVVAFVVWMIVVGSGAFTIWVRALLASAPVPLSVIIRMQLRRKPTAQVVDAYIVCRMAKAPVAFEELHLLSENSGERFAEEVKKLITNHMDSLRNGST